MSVAAPAPARGRAPAARSRRPPLRVVDADASRRARRVRHLLWGVAGFLVASLIAAVGFHVVLAQSQLELEQLAGRTAREQHRYQQLRLEVATLAFPERIVPRAIELGLVTPTEPPQTVAVPAGPQAPAAAAGSDGTATTLAESWPKVKPHLAEQP